MSVRVALTPGQMKRLEAAGWKSGEMALAEWLVWQAERLACERGDTLPDGWAAEDMGICHTAVDVVAYIKTYGDTYLDVSEGDEGWEWFYVATDGPAVAKGSAPYKLDAIEAAETARVAYLATLGAKPGQE